MFTDHELVMLSMAIDAKLDDMFEETFFRADVAGEYRDLLTKISETRAAARQM